MPENNLLVVAGDPSGDERAAEALQHLLKKRPDTKLFGIGGSRLENLGMEILYHLDDVTVFGFIEAVANYSRLKKVFNNIIHEYMKRKAVGALLVDFGGFNLRLARQLKNLPGKTIYYVSPQVWASRPERSEVMSESVDRLAVIFSFEREFYKKYGLETEHVGHPLLDSIPEPEEQGENKNKRKKLVIMPGSRISELKRLLPVISESIAILRTRFDLDIKLISAPGRPEWLKNNVSIDDLKITDFSEKYSTLASADCVLVASGTAALEVALFRKPAVVIYKTSLITGLLARFLLQVKYVSLPNILADKMIYPELLQSDCNAKNISNAMAQYLEDESACVRIRQQLALVREQLGKPGAAKRVAEILKETINWRE